MYNLNHLNYKVIGNGYPVVFLHGFLESIEMWNYFSLEKKFKCILFDLPGHGKSSHNTEEAVTMSSMAKKIMEMIDFLKIEEYGVVGHSMGGYVGLELKHQDLKCKKIVLLNSNFWADSELKQQDRRRVAEIVKKNKNLFLYEAIPNLFSHPESFNLEVKGIIEEAKNMTAEAIGAASIAMAERNSFESYLYKIKEHLLIIQGKNDTIVPIEMMKDALALFPEIQMKIIDSGHMAHIEKTVEAQEMIEVFLK